jgi:hypothetical protein
MPEIPLDIVDTLLSEADTLLLNIYSSSEFVSYTSFLQQLRELDRRAGDILAPIRTLLISALSHPCVESFAVAHQALVFPGRLTLRDNRSVERQMVEDWLDCDIWCYDPEAEKLRPFFDRHFAYFTMKDAVGSHGPGMVAEIDQKVSLAQKFRMMDEDTRIRYLNRHMNNPPLLGTEKELVRTSRLVPVPKSVRKRRIITIEPATLVWYQHAVRDAIKSMVDTGKLSRRIDLEHSELNRDLAELGSIDGEFSTIDLSNASDSVPLDALQRALPAHLYTCVYCARSSSTVLPDGTVYTLNKYAGMGNAITFIVESLYFCAIVEQGISEAGGKPSTSKYRVYGDDIVVESKYALSVLNCLRRHGFQPNQLKTFVEGNTFIFRESCGGEFLNGTDVTPLRLSRGFKGFDPSSPGSIQAVIDLVNETPRSLTSLRIYLIDLLMRLPKRERPMFTFSDDGIKVPYPSNEHLYKRYSFGLQEYLYRHGRIKAIRDSERRRHLTWCDITTRRLVVSSSFVDDVDEAIRYDEYLRVVRNRKRLLWPEDRVEVGLYLPDTIIWGVASDADH